MIKKILAFILPFFAVLAMAGCNSLVVEQESQQMQELPELTLEGDYLCGFHLTFDDATGKPISGIEPDFESDNAIKFYVAQKKYGSDDAYYTSVEEGLNVFFDAKSELYYRSSDNSMGREIKIYATVPYTYELLGGVVFIDTVHMKNDTYDLYTERGSGLKLGDIGSVSHTNNEELTANRTNHDGTEEKLSYKAEVKVEFYLIDYLTGVTVHEYSADNQLIISNEYVRGREYVYSENCAYMVLEEHYEIMHETEEKGMKYSEYTLIDPANYRHSHILKFPRGNGLIEPEGFTLHYAEDN